VSSIRPVVLACVGHAALDHVFEIDAFPAHPTKTPARAYRMQVGGMAANAALAAARLGARTRLYARVGDDAAGEFIRERLQAEGVDCLAVEPVPGAASSVSSIVVDAAGERQIFNCRGDALARAHPLDVRTLEGAAALLVDPRWMAGAIDALRWASQRDVITVLDADVAPREDLRRLVPMCRWAVFSSAGLAAYAPGAEPLDALREALSSGCDAAAVTRGEQGVVWIRGETPRSLAPPRVRARDTTAAGDVFHGALCVALAEGREETAAMGWANAAAAIKCANGLGALGAPRRAEVQALLGDA